MENTNKSIFTDNSLKYLSTASNTAKVIAVLTMFKICFLLYYFYSYYIYFKTDASSFALRYLGNSVSNIVLSVVSAMFLILFASKIDQAKRSQHLNDWNSAFSFFRNYLFVFILISINWMFFALLELIL